MSQFNKILEAFTWRLKLVVSVSLLGLFMLVPLMSAQALEDDTPFQCQVNMREYLNVEGKKFMNSINSHFQNSSSTTSLIPSANTAYIKYKDNIYLELIRLKFDLPDGMTQIRLLEELSRCDAEVENHIYMMDNVISAHVKTMASAKRNFTMIKQYQHLNEKLYGLNRDVGYMKGYFKVFDTKMEKFLPFCAS